MQQKCLSRTSGSVLLENLQPQARALGPLFITFDTKQAGLIYPRLSSRVCSSKDHGVGKRSPGDAGSGRQQIQQMQAQRAGDISQA